MGIPIFIIDGSKFSTLEEFYDHISTVFSLPSWWGRNLDAFDELFHSDILPAQGYHIIWKNIAVSQQRLGYEETVRQLSERLETCDPNNIAHIKEDLEKAQNGLGPTVFDWLIEIICDYCKESGETENKNDFSCDSL
ncbi:MAG: barstar family protein [Candidatus Lokiarchaeota archaeon]|nr:barstar family protein [Candidatus Lokiarchaeota archaeon]